MTRSGPATEPISLPDAIAALRKAARVRSATPPGSDARARAEADEWRLGELVWTLGHDDERRRGSVRNGPDSGGR